MKIHELCKLFTAGCVLTFASLPIAAQTSLGSVNIGSSVKATVTVTILSAATLGSISVRTQGDENLDFTNSDGGTCTVGAAYAENATCTVLVAFAPHYAGTRVGAVVLLDSTSNKAIFATAYLQGTGVGPQSAFLPQTSGPQVSNIAFPGGVAVDGIGNLYVSEENTNLILKETLGAGQSTVASGGPGVAVDGSGSVYITASTAVYKETPLAGGTYIQTDVGGTLTKAVAVAVDGSGSVYVADASAPAVYKEALQANGSYTRTSIGTGWGYPNGVAVDGSGNVYVTDRESKGVYKETLSNGTYSQKQIVANAPNLSAVAVSGTGNVYYAEDYDFPFDDGNGAIFLLIPQIDGTYIQTSIGTNCCNKSPEGLAVDSLGNVYEADAYSNSVMALDFDIPPTLAFANTLYGATSSDSPQFGNVLNIGNAPLQFSAVSFPTDYPESSGSTGDCSATTFLAAGSGCRLSIEFKPAAALSGTASLPLDETLTLSTNTLNAPGTQQTLYLYGTEIAPTVATPVITPVSGAYTSQTMVTMTDSTPNATIYYTTNDTTPTTSSTKYTGPITVTKDTIFIAFAVATGYTPSSTVVKNYNIITSTPTFSVPGGTYTAAQSVGIMDAAAGATIYYTTNGSTPSISSPKYSAPISVTSTETIQAYAFGPGQDASTVASATYTIVAPILSAAFSPTGLTFPATGIGIASAAQTVTLTNTGNTALTLGTMSFAGVNSGSFLKSATNCPASLAPGAHCTVSLECKPTAAGALTATFSIADNATNSPQTVSLSGTGSAFIVTPARFVFAAANVGSQTAPQQVILRNAGTTAVSFNGFSFTGADASSFAQTDITCGAALAANSACAIAIAFKPVASGALAASLSIADNVPGSPQSVALSGTGVASGGTGTLSITPNLTFVATSVGSQSAVQQVIVKNTGTTAIAFSGFTYTGANSSSFVQTDINCGSTLAAGSACAVAIAFKPQASGSLMASLSISDNASGTPQMVTLSGTGIAVGSGTLTVTPTSIAFPSTSLGSESAVRQVIVRNTGGTAVTLSSFTYTGIGTSSFVQTDITCGGSLAAGSACAVAIAFKPQASGALSATLNIADSASGSPQTVALSGTGN